MKYTVREKIKYPANKNLHVEDIAKFTQPSDAVKFAKKKAQERTGHDDITPYCYQVLEGEKVMNSYFNAEIL